MRLMRVRNPWYWMSSLVTSVLSNAAVLLTRYSRSGTLAAGRSTSLVRQYLSAGAVSSLLSPATSRSRSCQSTGSIMLGYGNWSGVCE
jgi:hypothetical protein